MWRIQLSETRGRVCHVCDSVQIASSCDGCWQSILPLFAVPFALIRSHISSGSQNRFTQFQCQGSCVFVWRDYVFAVGYGIRFFFTTIVQMKSLVAYWRKLLTHLLIVCISTNECTKPFYYIVLTLCSDMFRRQCVIIRKLICSWLKVLVWRRLWLIIRQVKYIKLLGR